MGGGAFCQSDMKSEYDDCARWDKYPNGCCDKECQTIKQACKDDNATRAGQWLTGLVLKKKGLQLCRHSKELFKPRLLWWLCLNHKLSWHKFRQLLLSWHKLSQWFR